MSKRQGPIEIVFNHWHGHDWRRVKRVGGIDFRCGLEVVLRNMTRHRPGCPCRVLLVVNEADEASWPRYRALQRRFPIVSDIIFRNNVGWDFGAYDEGYRRLREDGHTGDVVFMNTSVNGPHQDGWLREFRDLFHSRPRTGLCGASVNSHTTHFKARRLFRPHLQSYFVYTTMRVLRAVFPRHLPGAFVRSNKIALISAGETQLSTRVLEAGLGIRCTAFPDFCYFKGRRYALPAGSFRHFIVNRLNLPAAETERVNGSANSPVTGLRQKPAATVWHLPGVESVAIFGTGQAGREALELARRCGWRPLAFVDNDARLWQTTVAGLPVVPPDRLGDVRADLVIVASVPGREAISRQLTSAGLRHGKSFVHFLDSIQPDAGGSIVTTSIRNLN